MALSKNEITINLYEKTFGHSKTQKLTYQIIPNILNYTQFYSKHHSLTSSLRLFWFLRTHLANVYTKIKQVVGTDALRHSSKLVLWCWGSQKLLKGPFLLLLVWEASIMAWGKRNAGHYFCFFVFFIKVSIFFGFLLVTENRS